MEHDHIAEWENRRFSVFDAQHRTMAARALKKKGVTVPGMSTLRCNLFHHNTTWIQKFTLGNGQNIQGAKHVEYTFWQRVSIICGLFIAVQCTHPDILALANLIGGNLVEQDTWSSLPNIEALRVAVKTLRQKARNQKNGLIEIGLPGWHSGIMYALLCATSRADGGDADADAPKRKRAPSKKKQTKAEKEADADPEKKALRERVEHLTSYTDELNTRNKDDTAWICVVQSVLRFDGAAWKIIKKWVTKAAQNHKDVPFRSIFAYSVLGGGHTDFVGRVRSCCVCFGCFCVVLFLGLLLMVRTHTDQMYCSTRRRSTPSSCSSSLGTGTALLSCAW